MRVKRISIGIGAYYWPNKKSWCDASTVPPLYQGAKSQYVTGEYLGRRDEAMIWSQENCLFDNHRLTCE